MDMDKLCPCNNSEDDQLMILCDGCDIWFHGGCVALSNDQVVTLGESAEKWYCRNCLNSGSTQELIITESQIPCPRCPSDTPKKFYKGKRGLKLHYVRKHKDYISEVEPPKESTDDTDKLAMDLANLKRNVRVLKRIPRGARMMVALKLSNLMDQCKSNNLSEWKNFLLFFYTACHVPKKKAKNLTQSIKKNLSRTELPDIDRKQNTSTSLCRRVESKIAEGDVRGAVKILASSDSLAEDNDETLKKLKSKHPTPARPLIFPVAPMSEDPYLSVTEQEVFIAIQQFPNGSASGIDGLRPQHLKDLTAKSNGDAGKKFLSSLTNLCNFLLSGQVNENITKILYGATLCALNKKDGGIRPIAVGGTLRRLVAKLACKSVRNEMSSYLNPIQLGFGTRGGCEGAIHATRTYITDNKNSNKVILKVDFMNAFNCVERDSLLHQFKEKTPLLYPFLWQCYSSPTYLFYGEKRILSCVGYQQGDPAGPLGFSLVIHPIIQDLKSELNTWYLDDGTLGGDPETVIQDFKTVIEKCKKIGLHVNPSKCELFFCGFPDPNIISSFNSVSPGILIQDYLTLLGAPISENSIDLILLKKFDDMKLLLSRIHDLKYHIGYYILKHCVTVPKMTYLLRTTPCWKVSELIKQMDLELKNTLETLINTQLSSEKWNLSSLPVKYGGIGIRQLYDLIFPAFLSSVNSNFDLIQTMSTNITDISKIACYEEGLRLWSTLVDSEFIPPIPTSQQNWDQCLCRLKSCNVSFKNDDDRALHLANHLKESNSWLQVLPSRTIGTLLDNNTFRIAIALRLGCNICIPHKCICGEYVSERGQHGLSCKHSAGRQSRHHVLNDTLRRALVSAKIPTILEPTGMCRSDGRRPDGMTLIPWRSGRCLVWDSTCSDTLAPSYINHTSKVPGSAAKLAASKKQAKYREVSENYEFLPFAVETMGPWCQEARDFIDILGKRLNSITGEPRSKSYLIQRISIAIQKGNAACVMGTLPPSLSMEEIFYLL